MLMLQTLYGRSLNYVLKDNLGDNWEEACSSLMRFLLQTRVRLDYVTIQNRTLKLNFYFLVKIKVSDFNFNQFDLVI